MWPLTFFIPLRTKSHFLVVKSEDDQSGAASFSAQISILCDSLGFFKVFSPKYLTVPAKIILFTDLGLVAAPRPPPAAPGDPAGV